MPHNEFDIIAKYFQQEINRSDVLLGPGDDAAVLQPPINQELLSSADTLVSGTHFLDSTSADDIAHKAIAVSISDIAAMGGESAWLVLTLTLPRIDHEWLKLFCQGMHAILQEYNIALVGGDLTRGPLSITTQVTGFIPPGKAIKRSTAKPGDVVYVTGTLGGAGFALKQLLEKKPVDAMPLHRPTPRVTAGILLRNYATSAIDVSDGLAADLSHILKASEVGATIECDQLPLADSIKKLPKENAWRYALSAGDDYELCFTVPEKKQEALEVVFKSLDCQINKIGRIEARGGLRLINDRGDQIKLPHLGWQHF